MYNDRETLMKVLCLIMELKLQETVILIGSWDEYFYERLYSGYTALFRTLDTDFLIRRPVNTGKEFVMRMIQLGFIYEEDPLTGKSKFIKQDNEIEFLTALTRGDKHIYRVPELDINAECLKYMEIPSNNLIPYVFENGAYIQIPSPAAYCAHKILINDERTDEKQRKDAAAVQNILNSFSSDEEFKKSFQKVYSELGKKQRKKLTANAALMGVAQTVDSILKTDQKH